MSQTVTFPRALRCGVYHLISGGEVVYVGASTSILTRVAGWQTQALVEFDAVEIYPTPPDDLARVESEHIERYRPRHNAAGISAHYFPSGHFKKWQPPPSRSKAYQLAAESFAAYEGPAVSGSNVCRILGAHNRDELLRMAACGFLPAPVSVYDRRSYWPRDELVTWAQQRAQEAAADAAH